MLGLFVAVVIAMWWITPQPAYQTNSLAKPSQSILGASSVAGQSLSANQLKHSLLDQDAEWQEVEAELDSYVAKGLQLGALPQSLADTEVDGNLEVDSEGNLLINYDVRRFFEYYLSTIGEETLEEIKSRIAQALVTELPKAAAVQAWALFNRYSAYKQALTDVPPPDLNSTDALYETMEMRSALRKAWLGDEISDAFFGEEEAYDRYALAKRQVEMDNRLTDEQKQQQIEQITSQLPHHIKAVLDEVSRPNDVASRVEQMRQQGSSEADIHAYRQAQLGPEAAARFSELDKQRAAWQQRYDDYRHQRESILTSGLEQTDQQQQINALQLRLFDAQEQRRVQALDRITD